MDEVKLVVRITETICVKHLLLCPVHVQCSQINTLVGRDVSKQKAHEHWHQGSLSFNADSATCWACNPVCVNISQSEIINPTSHRFPEAETP